MATSSTIAPVAWNVRDFGHQPEVDEATRNASDCSYTAAESVVLRGVEPGILAKFDQLASSLPGMCQQELPIILMASFDGPLRAAKIDDGIRQRRT